jgi:hypothetical protein
VCVFVCLCLCVYVCLCSLSNLHTLAVIDLIVRQIQRMQGRYEAQVSGPVCVCVCVWTIS